MRCRGLQWWRWWDSSTGKKWRRTNGLVRTQNDSKSTGGRTWCRQRSPSSPATQMALRNQSKCPQADSNLLKIVGAGDSLQNLERPWSWCTQCGCATEVHQMPRGPKCVRHAGNYSLLMAGTGADWEWWRRLAPIGVEWWSRPRICIKPSLSLF